jgi:HAMP domain-containing protein
MRTGRLSIGVKLLLVLGGITAAVTGLALWMQDQALSSDLERAALVRLDGAAEAARLLAGSHVAAMRDRYRAISGTPQFRANLEVGDAATLTFYAQQLAEREGAALVAFQQEQGKVIALAGEAALAGLPEAPTDGLVARDGRAFARVRIPLETAGLSLGHLVAVEPVSLAVLETWSKLCGAVVHFAGAGAPAEASRVERVVQALPGALELRVGSSLEAERTALHHARSNLLFAGAVAVALAFAVGGVLSRSLVRPILRLQAAAERIARGDFGVRTATDRRDELGDVARAFDGMQERLRDTVSELRRSRERLENAQRLARVGSWQVDLQSGELLGSVEFRSLLGLPSDDPDKAVPHAWVLERIHPEERAEFERALRLSVRDGVGLYLDHRVVVDGDPFRTTPRWPC